VTWPGPLRGMATSDSACPSILLRLSARWISGGSTRRSSASAAGAAGISRLKRTPPASSGGNHRFMPVVPRADTLAEHDLVASMRTKVSRADYHPTDEPAAQGG